MTQPRQPIDERHLASAPTVLAICGDPVVGRALALLLKSKLYEVRFIPASSLSEPRSLEGVNLLLLTPTWELDAESREALLASLRDASDTVETPVLELSSSVGEVRHGATRARPEHVVPWPCSTEELGRRIQSALATGLTTFATSEGQGA